MVLLSVFLFLAPTNNSGVGGGRFGPNGNGVGGIILDVFGR